MGFGGHEYGIFNHVFGLELDSDRGSGTSQLASGLLFGHFGGVAVYGFLGVVGDVFHSRRSQNSCDGCVFEIGNCGALAQHCNAVAMVFGDPGREIICNLR